MKKFSRKKVIAWGIAGLIFAVIAIFAALKEESSYDLLKNTWQITSMVSPDGKKIKAAATDSIKLREDFTFKMHSSEQPEIKTGLWRMRNDSLLLTANFSRTADSVSHTLARDALLSEFYSGTEKIAEASSSSGLKVEQKVIGFSIKKVTAEHLEIEKNGTVYNLKKKESFLEKSENFVSTDSQGFTLEGLLRGMLGMITLIGIAWLFSTNRKKVNWKTVFVGLGLQITLAVSILYLPPVQAAFEFIGSIFVKILDFTKEGTMFLFKSFSSGEIEPALVNFAVQILPTIIFFAALTSLLFYLGLIQKIVRGLAWVMTRLMGLSGPESLSVAGNIFLGQTESPLMIKEYLAKMNRSEILLVMSGGMATLAGGVLAVYISFLGGDDPVARLMFAKHLLAASIMAAPGVVVVSKILVPQTEDINTDVEVSTEQVGKNPLDAISNGTGEGLKLAVNVAAMLLVFVAFIAMINYIFFKVGDWTNLNAWVLDITGGKFDSFSLEFILGYTFAPLMWLIGVDSGDITIVGQMLGEKIIMTEFIGYMSLAEYRAAGDFTTQKSVLMATYMLCGFANFASIGIQIGGIGSLAPGKRVLLSQFGLRALLAGTLASLLSATIVGMILG